MTQHNIMPWHCGPLIKMKCSVTLKIANGFGHAVETNISNENVALQFWNKSGHSIKVTSESVEKKYGENIVVIPGLGRNHTFIYHYWIDVDYRSLIRFKQGIIISKISKLLSKQKLIKLVKKGIKQQTISDFQDNINSYPCGRNTVECIDCQVTLI